MDVSDDDGVACPTTIHIEADSLDGVADSRTRGYKVDWSTVEVGKTWTTHDNGERPFDVTITAPHTIRISYHVFQDSLDETSDSDSKEAAVVPEPMEVTGVSDLWVGCTEGFFTQDQDDEETVEVDGAVLVAILDDGARAMAITSFVFSFPLRVGEEVKFLDGGFPSSDVWYATLHTNQRFLCFLEQQWFDADFIEEAQRPFVDPYEILYMERRILWRSRLMMSGFTADMCAAPVDGLTPDPPTNGPSLQIDVKLRGFTDNDGEDRVEDFEMFKARLPELHDMDVTTVWDRR